MKKYKKNPDCSEEEIIRMFYRYCQKALCNAKTDFYREQSRYTQHEQLFCDMRETERNKLATDGDIYFADTCFNVCGMCIPVSDYDLSEALSQLGTFQRTIILLYYFAGWSDKEIGQHFHTPRSTIQYQRTQTLRQLRQILEEGDLMQ